APAPDRSHHGDCSGRLNPLRSLVRSVEGWPALLRHVFLPAIRIAREIPDDYSWRAPASGTCRRPLGQSRCPHFPLTQPTVSNRETLMASTLKLLGGIVIAAALCAPAVAEDGLLTQKALSLGMAQTIASGAMESCKAMGYQISVAVVDRDGLTMVML